MYNTNSDLLRSPPPQRRWGVQNLPCGYKVSKNARNRQTDRRDFMYQISSHIRVEYKHKYKSKYKQIERVKVQPHHHPYILPPPSPAHPTNTSPSPSPSPTKPPLCLQDTRYKIHTIHTHLNPKQSSHQSKLQRTTFHIPRTMMTILNPT